MDDTFTYAISLSDISGGMGAGDDLVIAAHAVVEHSEQGKETAWGIGERFVDSGNWAMYFGYSVR